VFDNCKALKPLKGVEVTLQTVEFWFREMIKNGWTKKIFDERLEAVKRTKIFGIMIDWNVWVESELTYNQYEMNRLIERTISSKIQEANELKEKGVTLDDETKRFIEYSAAQKFINESMIERTEKLESLIETRKEEIKKEKRQRIKGLTEQQKIALLQLCEDNKHIKISSKEERSIILSNLSYYADLIPDELFETLKKQ
jgi:predicted transcriptional regulator